MGKTIKLIDWGIVKRDGNLAIVKYLKEGDKICELPPICKERKEAIEKKDYDFSRKKLKAKPK